MILVVSHAKGIPQVIHMIEEHQLVIHLEGIQLAIPLEGIQLAIPLIMEAIAVQEQHEEGMVKVVQCALVVVIVLVLHKLQTN